jgi:ATP-dependent DNA helicase DinG
MFLSGSPEADRRCPRRGREPHLFFTLLNGQSEFQESGEGFLFAKDFLIFDEAHTLEQVAARQLGLALSQTGMKFDLHRLFNPKNKKGLFQLTGDMEGRRLTMALLDEIDEFFDRVEGNCKWGEYGREFRIREPEFVEDTLGSGLIEVSRRARAIAELADETTKNELGELARRLADCRAALGTFLDQRDDGLVYWVEKNERESLSLNAAPVNVAELLKPVFFDRNRPCIFTSATLGVGERDLGYFRKRVGAGEVEAIRIGSPFDYAKQMTIHLVKTMPEPTDRAYEGALAKWIRHFIRKSGRARLRPLHELQTPPADLGRARRLLPHRKDPAPRPGGGHLTESVDRGFQERRDERSLRHG